VDGGTWTYESTEKFIVRAEDWVARTGGKVKLVTVNSANVSDTTLKQHIANAKVVGDGAELEFLDEGDGYFSIVLNAPSKAATTILLR